MRRGARRSLRAGMAVITSAIALLGTRGEAHKPITSPYTFNEDVFPILRDQCGRCHVSGGVAPMSLMTHQDTVPWGESLRIELIAGHMPPWSAETSAGRFRNVRALSARELNTVLTWASGGTPAGDEAKNPAAVAIENTWRLGTPDAVLPLPEFAMSADAQDQIAEFVVPVGERWLRAIDLLPGTPALVRSATIEVRTDAGAATDVGAAFRRPALLRWQPGDDPVALEDAAFRLPAGSELVVTMKYKKTWEYERKAMTDRSSIGLYFAAGAPSDVRALNVTLPGLVLDESVRVLAISPDPALANTSVRVEAVKPDGSRELLIAFRPAAGWTRRYWFESPVSLPRGTRIGISAASAGETRPRVILDVIP
jgi:hypothetical protein